jgi:hypothetical protein
LGTGRIVRPLLPGAGIESFESDGTYGNDDHFSEYFASLDGLVRNCNVF